MIPKIIHYCWFGGNPLPELAIKCIESWKKYFPDYEIKEWNESNFDVHSNPYIHEAYNAKKFAFVSDYARFWILYKFGGIYFDTDVEVIKDMNPIIKKGAFMGCQIDAIKGSKVGEVAPGLGLAIEPNNQLYKEIIDYYDSISFINDNGSYNQVTVVEHVTNLLVNHGLTDSNDIQECCGIIIYPKEFFCPLDYRTGELLITKNTYTIHHYMASWHSTKQHFFCFVSKIIGVRLAHNIANLLKNLHLIK